MSTDASLVDADAIWGVGLRETMSPGNWLRGVCGPGGFAVALTTPTGCSVSPNRKRPCERLPTHHDFHPNDMAFPQTSSCQEKWIVLSSPKTEGKFLIHQLSSMLRSGQDNSHWFSRVTPASPGYHVVIRESCNYPVSASLGKSAGSPLHGQIAYKSS